MSGFTLRSLSVLAYANGFTLWHYKASNTTLGPVCNPGFFADAADLLATGDMVLISAQDGGGIRILVGEGRRIQAVSLT